MLLHIPAVSKSFFWEIFRVTHTLLVKIFWVNLVQLVASLIFFHYGLLPFLVTKPTVCIIVGLVNQKVVEKIV